MTIKTRDELVNAMANGAERLIFDKASISNAAAGQWHSLWRATGQPGQGAIPAGAAACDHTTVGGHGFAQRDPRRVQFGDLVLAKSDLPSDFDANMAAAHTMSGRLSFGKIEGVAERAEQFRKCYLVGLSGR